MIPGMDAHRLAEERSIAMHAVIARRLDASAVERARERVLGWEPGPYAEGWLAWLELPLPQLRERLVDPGEEARALRQVSPFAGVLTARERWAIRKSVA